MLKALKYLDFGSRKIKVGETFDPSELVGLNALKVTEQLLSSAAAIPVAAVAPIVPALPPAPPEKSKGKKQKNAAPNQQNLLSEMIGSDPDSGTDPDSDDRSIYDMKLSPEVCDALEKAGILHVDDIRVLGVEDLVGMAGLTKEQAEETMEAAK
jgi:hypothetical protein